MGKTIIFLVVILSAPIGIYSQNSDIQIPSFLDSTDFQIIFNKKKVRMYELTGSPVDSSIQNKKSKYIFNYLVKSALNIDNTKFIKLITPVLTCQPSVSQVPKCTYLFEYCLEIQNNKGKLYLFFSEDSNCNNYLKVIKVNTISHKESHNFFNSNLFMGLL